MPEPSSLALLASLIGLASVVRFRRNLIGEPRMFADSNP
jgi:hypothetical protein